MTPVATERPSSKTPFGGIVTLIGRSPDPESDIPALRCLTDVEEPNARELAETLRTDPSWQRQPLSILLPGLELIEPTLFWDQLGVRACNALRRSGIVSWSDVCRVSATGIEEIYGAGREVVEETLRATVREWAAAYLTRWGALEAVDDHASPPSPAPDGGLGYLDAAFADLERVTGFKSFELRRLQPGPIPTYRAMALQMGRTRQAHSERVNRIDRTIKRRMRDEAWPLGIAVRQMESQLGSLALPAELFEILDALHRTTGALPERRPSRRTLLLRIAQYRVTQEWILGPDVEKLTAAVITAFAKKGATDIDRLAKYLSVLGIREHLQLPWLASQPGYRIVNGTLVPSDR